MKVSKFNTRGCTTFVVALSFITMTLTGVALYITPRGRVAHWTGWTFVALNKDQWMAVHTTTSILFILAAAVHLYLNWKPFVHYIKSKTVQGFHLKTEFGVAAVLLALVFVGTLWNLPPFDAIMRLNRGIKTYWDKHAVWLPYPHAEESTLEEFASKMGWEQAELLEFLRERGFDTDDPSVTVGALAERHNVSPSEMLGPLADARGHGFGGGGRGSGMGQGFGRMTVEQVCSERGIELEAALAALRDRGIKARGSDTLRTLAVEHGMRPGQLVAVIQSTASGP